MKDGRKALCPRCGMPLDGAPARAPVSLLCPSCGGREITLQALRGLADSSVLKPLWRSARHPIERTEAVCPHCGGPMARAAAPPGAEDPPLACTSCQRFWFSAEGFPFTTGAAGDEPS